ncbi:MAG TPA: cadherin-like domain-containing protein, partial [Xanthobacteraceae bacterium]|nr:cadherin-like domain-containing protein [Xanthobacteraceae bacterium]
TVNPDGTLNYTPNADFFGLDTITYVVSDGNGGSDTGEVAVTVNPVNDAPVAVDDTATTNEDTPVIIDVLGNDIDVDGDTLLIDGTPTALNGIVTVNPDGTLNYTPNANFNGTDTITYVVSDGNGGSDTGEVVVTVNPIDDPVDANFDTAAVTVQGKGKGHGNCKGYGGNGDDDNGVLVVDAAGGVLANDTGDGLLQVSAVNGDASKVGTAFELPSGAMLTLNADGSYTYDASTLDVLKHIKSGTIHDTFTYTATDEDGDSETTVVDITVNVEGRGKGGGHANGHGHGNDNCHKKHWANGGSDDHDWNVGTGGHGSCQPCGPSAGPHIVAKLLNIISDLIDLIGDLIGGSHGDVMPEVSNLVSTLDAHGFGGNSAIALAHLENGHTTH